MLQCKLLSTPLIFEIRCPKTDDKVTDCSLKGLPTQILMIFICEEREKKMYSNNPHILNELKHKIHEIVLSAEVSELKLISDNIYMRQKGDILSI
jgi:hypothetical protein